MLGGVFEVQVLVIGAGPVGLITAFELAQHGVQCTLIDKALQGTNFPKMDITNGRSMELLRRLGLARTICGAGGPSDDDPYNVVFTRRIGDEQLSVWEYESWNQMHSRLESLCDGSGAIEPHKRISQIDAEAALREVARENERIDFREGWCFETLAQDDTGVECTLFDTRAGSRHIIRSSYVIACDGASSAVRKLLGIKLRGRSVPLDTYMVHFKSTDRKLFQYGKFWHLVFEKGGAIVSQNGKDTWTCHGLPPPGTDFSTIDPVTFVADVAGTAIELEVLTSSPWRAGELLAERYVRGRVLLAGDAAHQMYPAGGYGMNTGIGDAVGAGWMVAALVNGWGGDHLLEAYEIERQEQGRRAITYSNFHLRLWLDWWERASGDNSSRFGKPGTEGYRAEAHRYLQAHRGENEFYGVELDYRYHLSPIVVVDGSPEPAWDPRHYTPTTWPGSRPPSVRLQDGSLIFDAFGAGYTLVDLSGDNRLDAFVNAFSDIGAPLKCLQVNDERARKLWEQNYVLVRPDQHVAWRSDNLPASPLEIAKTVCGY